MKLTLNNFSLKYFSIDKDAIKDYVVFSENGTELKVDFSDGFDPTIIVAKKENELIISCPKKYFFRALGIAIKNKNKKSFHIIEKPRFKELTFFLDCSRNGVINFETFKNLVVKLALVGYNSLQIYMEDTIELDGEPYFGHLRGRFSSEELKQMDDFATNSGIELVPCIQTLAHFDNIFLWPKYEKVWDIYNVMMIGESTTYNLIEKIFKTLRQSLRTDKINIGFDEADGVCFGQYAKKHGVPKNRIKVIVDHLKKVLAIAEKYGFHASMWSDMFFKLAYNGDYYPDKDVTNDPLKKIKKLIPENVDLIYWDYYHDNKKHYDTMFQRHKALSNDLQFACGAWKWLGFAPLNNYGINRILPGLRSAIDNNIPKAIVTTWGDNGNEAPLFCIIPQIVVAAEYAYTNGFNLSNIKKTCKELFFASYDDFISLDLPNRINYELSGNYSCNPSKYLLYNDPVYGLFDYHTNDNYCEHYKNCVKIFKNAEKRNLRYRNIFVLEKTLCDYLGIKANFGNTLKALYEKNDKEGLEYFAKKTVPLAIKKLDAFIIAARESWLKDNKIFGLDVLELRLGGQRQRLKEITIRIKEYLDGKVDSLPELTQQALSFAYGEYEDKDIFKGLYAYMATPAFSLERR
ncbi:MAG: family 20 glycosylhydrolase [Clostridia bacterium]|nr:family 20 glycosylhydrolase [Clostridia bacterium]